MNLWACDHPGCTSKAVGVGPALGLRAVGWYVSPPGTLALAPVLLCPAHHPSESTADHDYESCPVRIEASRLQDLIAQALGEAEHPSSRP